MTVRKPDLGDPSRAARIRRAASACVTPVCELEAQQAERQRAVAEFREQTESLHQAEQPQPPRPKTRDRRRQPQRSATETIGEQQ